MVLSTSYNVIINLLNEQILEYSIAIMYRGLAVAAMVSFWGLLRFKVNNEDDRDEDGDGHVRTRRARSNAMRILPIVTQRYHIAAYVGINYAGYIWAYAMEQSRFPNE